MAAKLEVRMKMVDEATGTMDKVRGHAAKLSSQLEKSFSRTQYNQVIGFIKAYLSIGAAIGVVKMAFDHINKSADEYIQLVATANNIQFLNKEELTDYLDRKKALEDLTEAQKNFNLTLGQSRVSSFWTRYKTMQAQFGTLLLGGDINKKSSISKMITPEEKEKANKDKAERIARLEKEAAERKKIADEARKKELKRIDDEYNVLKDSGLRKFQLQKAQMEEDLKIIDQDEERGRQHVEELRKIAESELQMTIETSQAIGAALGSGFGQGAEGLKNSLKAVTIVILDTIEKQIEAGWIAAGVQSIIVPGLGFTVMPRLIALSAAFAALKAGVQNMETGGFPSGRNAMVRMNERGQESILNARATANLGRGAIDALNRGQTTNNVTTNKPIVVVMSRGDSDIAGALERATRDRSINWNRILQGVV